ncbi:MAG: pentapeptide repeat-containing protein [Elainella sp.]
MGGAGGTSLGGAGRSSSGSLSGWGRSVGSGLKAGVSTGRSTGCSFSGANCSGANFSEFNFSGGCSKLNRLGSIRLGCLGSNCFGLSPSSWLNRSGLASVVLILAGLSSGCPGCFMGWTGDWGRSGSGVSRAGETFSSGLLRTGAIPLGSGLGSTTD